jgi:hypothetical protein
MSQQYFTLTTIRKPRLPIKNINIRFCVVKEKIQDRTISLEHISTRKMITDPLTKGLPPNVFQNTCQHEFKVEPMILDVKGPRQESALK